MSLKKDEFSDKKILFYVHEKKDIKIIALLVQDETIELAFCPNQLIRKMTDGNLLLYMD